MRFEALPRTSLIDGEVIDEDVEEVESGGKRAGRPSHRGTGARPAASLHEHTCALACSRPKMNAKLTSQRDFVDPAKSTLSKIALFEPPCRSCCRRQK